MLLLSAMALGLVVESTKTSTDLKVTRDTDILGNDTQKSTGPGDWTIEHCTSWHRPNHLYYQLGNAFFFLAFVAPHGSYGMLWLRCSLVIGCILLTMWGWIIECTGDVVLWSTIFLATNLVYLVILMCRLRPVRFEKEIESIYSSLFQPLRVSRYQFKKILSCMKVIRSLRYQEVYAQEKVSKIDSLSLVLSGKLVVSQNQKALHIVFSNQFLDSPEWFGVSTDDFSQVSITAIEESRVLIWHRDKLKLSIMEEPFLQTVFDHILSRDVVKKLMQVTQVNETMAASNGFLPGDYDEAKDKPMLLMKKGSADGHGITALISRQLQDIGSKSERTVLGWKLLYEKASFLLSSFEEHVPLLGQQSLTDHSLHSPEATKSLTDLKTSAC